MITSNKMTLVDLYLESGLSMVDLAAREGIEVAEVSAAVSTYSRDLLSRVKQQAMNAMPAGVTCEIMGHSAPVPSEVTIEVRPSDSWIDHDPLDTYVRVDTSQPIVPQLAARIAAVVAVIESPHHVSEIDEAGLPIGVYEITRHYFGAEGWHREAGVDRTGVGYVKQLMLDGRCHTKEVIVCHCQSQHGGCVVAGSAEAMRRWKSQ